MASRSTSEAELQEEEVAFAAFEKNLGSKEVAKQLKATQQAQQAAAKLSQQQIKNRQVSLQARRAQAYLGPAFAQLDARSIDASLPNRGSVLPVVFVCIDVEAFEFNSDFITEIGISTLDVANIVATPSGPRGFDWRKAIVTRHLRTQEYAHLKNRVHVEGYPDRFEHGKSEFVNKQRLALTLERLFEAHGAKERVVLVGHDIKGDIAYLAKVGFDVTRWIYDCVDTIDLQRAATRNFKQHSLTSLLLHYRIPGKYLHNAGNDAYFTLRAMIIILVEMYQNPKSAAEWNEIKLSRVTQACKEATEKVLAEFDGWSDNEDESAANLPVIPVLATKRKPDGAKNVTTNRPPAVHYSGVSLGTDAVGRANARTVAPSGRGGGNRRERRDQALQDRTLNVQSSYDPPSQYVAVGAGKGRGGVGTAGWPSVGSANAGTRGGGGRGRGSGRVNEAARGRGSRGRGNRGNRGAGVDDAAR